MPDFEALIRHQQLNQPTNDKRLKIVAASDSNKKESLISDESNSKPKFINFFLAGFSGSLLATLSLLFLYDNNFFSLDIDNIRELITTYF